MHLWRIVVHLSIAKGDLRSFESIVHFDITTKPCDDLPLKTRAHEFQKSLKAVAPITGVSSSMPIPAAGLEIEDFSKTTPSNWFVIFFIAGTLLTTTRSYHCRFTRAFWMHQCRTRTICRTTLFLPPVL